MTWAIFWLTMANISESLHCFRANLVRPEVAEVGAVIERQVLVPGAQADVDFHRRVADSGSREPEGDRVANFNQLERCLAAAEVPGGDVDPWTRG
jgi:hypothetical protein